MEIFLSVLNSILSVVVMITIVVFVHELGHYIVARMLGVKVLEFSVGFGKKLFSFKDRAGTEWKICAILLGGYTKFFGDTDATSIDEGNLKSLSAKERKYAFCAKGLLAKSAIMIAGPMANFILAIVLLTGIFYIKGQLVYKNEIGIAEEDGIGYKQGLRVGDIIIAINGKKMTDFFEIQRSIASNAGIELAFTVKRNEQIFVKKITPENIETESALGIKVPMGNIQISHTGAQIKYNGLLDSIILAVNRIYEVYTGFFTRIKEVFVGRMDSKELGGIFTMSKYAGAATKSGLVMTCAILALMSAYLALINLVPMPPLDGGHLFLYAIKAVFGHKVYLFAQKFLVRIGIVLLIGLVLFTMFNDAVHL